MVSGFTTMPDSYFLTWRTCSACPRIEVAVDHAEPPACAMAIAMRASVTVSIAEAMIGRLRKKRWNRNGQRRLVSSLSGLALAGTTSSER
jgi:hypothetical protein